MRPDFRGAARRWHPEVPMGVCRHPAAYLTCRVAHWWRRRLRRHLPRYGNRSATARQCPVCGWWLLDWSDETERRK